MQATNIPALPAYQNLGLYVHIPFCQKKCDYCDFYSIAGAPLSIVESVLEQTLGQLHFFMDRLDPDSIDTIYFGGGTPSSIDRKVLDGFIGEIQNICAGKIGEWTIEANPESLDRDFLSICADHGITRLSMGLQTFVPGELESIGRNATQKDNLRAVALAHKLWKGDLNVDLLAGLPGQTSRTLLDGIRFCIAELEPSHVSFYSLTIESGTKLEKKLGRGECALPQDFEQDDLWLSGYELLENSGYLNYEISNFSRPGKECLHNLKYWHMEPYLGVGPGAVSTLPDNSGGVTRFENPSDIGAFCSGLSGNWGIRSEKISPRDFIFENFMMGFRLKEGIKRDIFYSRFGMGMEDMLGTLWQKWISENLIKDDITNYALTKRARLMLNHMLRELKEHLDSLPNDIPPLTIKWP